MTDRDIRRAVRTTGACSAAEVGDHCGATTGCGGCYEVVAELVACEKRRLAMVQSAADVAPTSLEPAASAHATLALTG